MYNYTAIFENINSSTNKNTYMKILYFVVNNKYSINLLTNADYLKLMSDIAIIEGISDNISVDSSESSKIDSITDVTEMNEIFTSSELSLQSSLVSIFNEYYSLSQET